MPKQEPIIDDDDLDLDHEVIHVNGRRLTEEYAAEIADEAERISRGRERSKENLVPGGKSLSGDGEVSPPINVRVPKVIRKQLQEMAEMRGASLSKLARQTLEDSVQFYVCFEQSFDGAGFELVRIDKPLSLEDARMSFEHFRNLASALKFRSVQIRRGRDEIVERWPELAHTS
jgi:predicted HicB family RNase H-like nuclease